MHGRIHAELYGARGFTHLMSLADDDDETLRVRDDDRKTASMDFAVGNARFRAEMSVTPAHVLAIGALVSGILLSTAALVWTSTSVARVGAKGRTRRKS